MENKKLLSELFTDKQLLDVILNLLIDIHSSQESIQSAFSNSLKNNQTSHEQVMKLFFDTVVEERHNLLLALSEKYNLEQNAFDSYLERMKKEN